MTPSPLSTENHYTIMSIIVETMAKTFSPRTSQDPFDVAWSIYCRPVWRPKQRLTGLIRPRQNTRKQAAILWLATIRLELTAKSRAESLTKVQMNEYEIMRTKWLEIASQNMDIEAKRSMEPMKVVQSQQIPVVQKDESREGKISRSQKFQESWSNFLFC